MRTILGLGSNLGDRFAALSTAIEQLSSTLSDIKHSAVYECPALLKPNAPAEWNKPFLNMAIEGECSLEPLELLKRCKEIESKMGRIDRSGEWAPRVIDIDILVMGDEPHNSETLTIPHAGLLQRDFALTPLLDLWPNYAPAIESDSLKRIGQFS